MYHSINKSFGDALRPVWLAERLQRSSHLGSALIILQELNHQVRMLVEVTHRIDMVMARDRAVDLD